MKGSGDCSSRPMLMANGFTLYSPETERALVRAMLDGSQRISLADIASKNTAVPKTMGVYRLLYQGDHPLYETYARLGVELYTGRTSDLRKRGRTHLNNIISANNLDKEHFQFVFLPMPAVHQCGAAEEILLEYYTPVWNRTINGIGNNALGASRESQALSAWDTLHPGRPGRTGAQIERPDDLTEAIRLHAAATAKKFGRRAPRSLKTSPLTPSLF